MNTEHQWQHFPQKDKPFGRWQCKMCGRTAYTKEPPTDYPPCFFGDVAYGGDTD